MSHAMTPKPLTAKACGRLSGRVRPPGDKSISSRLSARPPRRGKNSSHRPARRRGRAEHRPRLRATRRKHRAFGRRPAGPSAACGLGALLGDAATRFRQCRNGFRLMMGVVAAVTGSPRASTATIRCANGRCRRILDPLVLMAPRSWSKLTAAVAPSCSREHAIPRRSVSHPRCVRADQVCRAARGIECARPHHRPGNRGQPRSHGKDARLFWRDARQRTVRRTWTQDHARRPPGTLATTDRGPGRSVLGRIPDSAALLVNGSDVVMGVGMNPLRAGFVTTLLEMGDIEVLETQRKAASRSPIRVVTAR